MKVKATKLGYFNNRRVREGEVFVIADDKKDKAGKVISAFSKNWMKKLDDDSKEKTEVKKEKVVKPVPLAQAAKANESFEDEPKTPTGAQEVI